MQCGLYGIPRNNNVSDLTLKRGPDIGFTIAARYGDTGLSIPVPTIRPTKENSSVAVDIAPRGPNPVEFAGNGFAWVDVCDADVQDANSVNGNLIPIHCARVAMLSTAAQFGSVNFNGATDLPVQFMVGSGSGTGIKAEINSSGQLKIGRGVTSPVTGGLLYVNPTTADPFITIRDDVNNSEFLAAASSSVFVGSATSHPFVVRTNNTNRATFDTSGNLTMAAGYVAGTNIYATGGSLRTVQTVDVTNRSTASTSFVASGVISPSITPTSSSNKILVTVSGLVGADAGAGVFFTLFRSINGGAYADITPASTTEMQGFVIGTNALTEALSFSFLDSPAVTTAVLYQLYWKVNTSTGRLGRRGTDTLFNSPTIITATEIKG